MMIRPRRFPVFQRGVALLVVLWGCTLAAITLGALAANARVESLQAGTQARRAQALYAAEAGIEQAVYLLRARDEAMRWRPGSRPHDILVGDTRVTVSIGAEDGKINLNTATPERIEGLLKAAGVETSRAASIRKAIVDWGDPGKSEHSTALARGGFASLEELQRVPGIDAEVVARIEPALTLWSAGDPNLAFASPLVVAAVTGADLEAARSYVEQLRSLPPGTDVLPAPPGYRPAEASLHANVNAFDIVARASLAGGVETTLDVVVSLKSEPGDPRPYRVLRWRETSSLSGDDRALSGNVR